MGNPLRRWEYRPGTSTRRWGEKGGDQALGWSRGGFSTKLHVRAEGQGKPITFVLTGGERHEVTVFEQLLTQGAIKRASGGRPRKRPKRIVGDKGYSYPSVRRFLRRRGIRYTIPCRSDQHATGPFDKATYRQRNRVERLINRLKQFRRIATRYEKLAASYLAMLHLAAILLWI